MKSNLSPDGPSFRILCVEDSPVLQGVWKIALERHGFEVVTACDGIDALTQYQAHGGNFRAILTDNDMPRMNGRELVRSLREIGFKGRIVVMSGNFRSEDLRAYHDDAVSGFFHKPFEIDLLATMLLQAD